ncbi:hypothetical protein [Roseovarius aestuariivivens]|uniref:hypothetical protein n=1 Tax=Roseovarius aestuariivivens TaxID=1888910 RepID=UPI0010808085|nr:hypothetical protein [Roseovarius aestuariivivens]
MKTPLSFGLSIAAVVVAGLVLTGANDASGTGDEAENPYISKAIIEETGPPPEGGEAADVYLQLLKESAYAAAFALSDTGAFGWADNHADIDLAEALALRRCTEHASDCRIVLRITPETPVQVDGFSLSYTTARALGEYTYKPVPKAVALSNRGDWGMAWGQMSKGAAEKVALANCEKHLPKKDPAGWPDGVCKNIWAE